MDEYQTYTLLGIAVAGFVTKKVIEYTQNNTIEYHLNRIKDHTESIRGLIKKINQK
ncbi:MAG: hypothetical protein WC438_00965 [Candidatus Pacearchaeota archaeon]